MNLFPYDAPRMRIAVDLAATVGQKSGLGFYVEQMLTGLRALPNAPELLTIQRVTKNLRTPTRVLWDQVGLPLSAWAKKPDMLFVPAFSAPRFPKPIVMTAHDIFGVVHPDQFHGAARYYWSRLLPQSMKRATHLICVSEYTRRAIAQHLCIPLDRMTVIPNAVSPLFRVMDNVASIQHQLQQLDVRTPFILSVGTIEPRKNYERLIEAFAFSQRGTTSLVIVGKKGWNYDGVFAKIRKYHLQNTVTVLDYITQEQLVALYNACLFFVMPSIYEGFGMPALEAMQCGAPVAVAQNTSLPEVVGEAGVLFDPFDTPSIRQRLDLLLTDEQLRLDMQRKSAQRSRQFSWQHTAAETMRVFEHVIARQ